MNHYHKLLGVISIALIAGACSRAVVSNPANNPNSPKPFDERSNIYNTPLQINHNRLSVAVMRTAAELQAGLSHREKLQDEQGMLFQFNGLLAPGFWMKDMTFDLDIIWIREGKIVGITENVPAPRTKTADSDLPVYYPPSNIDQALEVNAGWSKQHDIKIGDEIKL